MRKKNKLTSDDKKLFRESAGKVQPIKDDKISPELKKTPHKKAPPHKEAWQTDLTPLSSTDTVEFAQEDFSKNALKQLKSGKFDIDAELDLHGMTILKAEETLSYFLQKCLAEDLLCVLIIHGKSHGDYDHPILKNEVNLWLRESEHVLAFCNATPKDGGTGAVYAILKGNIP